MHKQGNDECMVCMVQSMYKKVRNRIRVGIGYIKRFGIGVGVHKGSVPSLLFFIVVLETITGCPWELLYIRRQPDPWRKSCWRCRHG